MIRGKVVVNSVLEGKSRSTLLIGILLFILALTISQISVWQSKEQFQGSTDETGYIHHAVSVLSGRGFNEFPGYNQSNRVPLYPFLIAGVFKVFGHSFLAIKVVQGVILALSVVLVFIIGKLLFSTTAGIFAGILVSISPNFLRYVHYIMAENLFTFFFLLSIFFFICALIYKKKIDYVFFGISLGFTTLIRPTSVYFIIYSFFVCLLVFWKQKNRWKDLSKGLLLAGFVFLLVLSPWMVRNFLIHKHFVFLNTQGPRVLAVSMHKISASETSNINLLSGDFFSRVDRLTDYERYQEYRKLVNDYLSENPGVILELLKIAPRRLAALWSLRGTPPLGGYLGFWTPLGFDWLIIPLAFFGIITGLFLRRTNSLLLIGVILYFNLIHLIMIADPRYRVPFMPLVIIFASYFLCVILRRIWGYFNALENREKI